MKSIEGLTIREGNIYPILARLKSDGLVKSVSRPSTDGPPRKYFHITDKGSQMLEDMNVHFDALIKSISEIRKGNIND